MRSKRSRFLVFAIAIGSVGLLTLFFITSALEETPEKRKARELGYLREWVACDFVDVDETFESKVLPQIPKTISPGIRAEQEAAATEAVAGFVKAFSSGRYEDFKAFRMPAKYSISQSNLAFRAKLIQKASQNKALRKSPPANIVTNRNNPPDWAVLGIPKDPPPQLPRYENPSEDVVESIYRTASQGMGYNGYFDGFCIKKSHLALIHSNQRIPFLSDYVMKNEDYITAVSSFAGPNSESLLVRFERTPRDILEETGD